MAVSAEQLAANLAQHREYLTGLQKQGNLDSENLGEATKKIHSMIQDAQRIADTVADENLQAFLNIALRNLQSQSTIASQTSANDAQSVENPEQVMAKNGELAQALQGLLGVLIKSPEKAEVANSLISATEQTLETFGKITQKWDVMSTTEKVTASVGMTVTLVGIGLLVATAINPGLGVLALAGICIGVGIWLCKRALANHDNDNDINDSLDKTHSTLDKVASRLDRPKAKDTLSFSKKEAQQTSSDEPSPTLESTKKRPKRGDDH